MIKKFDGKDFTLRKVSFKNSLKSNQCFEANVEDFEEQYRERGK